MELLDKKARDAYIARTKKAQTALRSGLNQRVNTPKRIARSKLVSDLCYRQIVPLQFTLPFNPFNPSDEGFNQEVVFQMEGSAYTGAAMFKYLLGEAVKNDDREFLDVVEDRMGIDIDTFDFKVENLTPVEEKALWSYRQPVAWIRPVIATQFSNRRVPYPSIRAVRCEFDEDGNPVYESENNDISLTLYRIETQMIVKEIEELEKTFEPGGVNSHLSDKVKKDQVSAFWKERLISKPFLKYAFRFLEIPYLKQEQTPDKEAATLYEKGDFFSMERIKLCGRKTIDAFIGDIGSKKDTNFDYLEYMYVNPHIPKDKENQKGAFTRDIQCHIAGRDDRIIECEGWEGFQDKYRVYRDNPEYFTDKIIFDSLTEFRYIESDSLVQLFTNDLGKYVRWMEDEQIKKLIASANLESAMNLIAEIDNTFAGDAESGNTDYKTLMNKDKQNIEGLREADSETIQNYGQDFGDLGDLIAATDEDAAKAEAEAPKPEVGSTAPEGGVDMSSAVDTDLSELFGSDSSLKDLLAD